MSEKVTVTISDETAEELRESVSARRKAIAREKERLRNGARSGSQVEELSGDYDTDTETAVKGAIQYALKDL